DLGFMLYAGNALGAHRLFWRGGDGDDIYVDGPRGWPRNALPEFQGGQSEQDCERIRRNVLSGLKLSLHFGVGCAAGFRFAMVGDKFALAAANRVGYCCVRGLV